MKSVKKFFAIAFIFAIGVLTSGAVSPHIERGQIAITAFPVIHKKGHALAYDGRTKIPLWVYEEISSQDVLGKVDRTECCFMEDPEVYPLHKSTLEDYKKSGYDRGHMAPAGDFRNSKEKMQDTFYLSNIAPQCPQLNRGYWLKLEKHVRQLAKDHGKVFVITGPVFVPIQKGNKRFVSYEVIGKNDVGVPTHFFKVIRAKNSNGALLQEAYLIPNQQVDQKRSLSEFEVSIEKLEKISGLIFERI